MKKSTTGRMDEVRSDIRDEVIALLEVWLEEGREGC